MAKKGTKHDITKYDTVIVPHLSDIKEWIMSGVTDREICKRLKMSPDTWYRHVREHGVLSDIIKSYKEVMDKEVEKALIKSAMGFEYEEVRTIIEEDKNGKKKTRIEKVKKYQPPNSTAMIFWLKNRQPEQWNDRKEIILDTKEQEEARKKLFLDMIDDEIKADYEVVDEDKAETDIETIEEVNKDIDAQ